MPIHFLPAVQHGISGSKMDLNEFLRIIAENAQQEQNTILQDLNAMTFFNKDRLVSYFFHWLLFNIIELIRSNQ